MASSIQHFTSRGGGDVTVSSTTTATFTNIQSVTSHGNETVSDTASPTKIAYHPGKAVLTPVSGGSSSGKVHIPIHNPPNLREYQNWNLKNILVEFDSSGASVNVVQLFYNNKLVVSANPSQNGTFHIDFSANEAENYRYVPPAGISVTLEINFNAYTSSVNLYSATVGYKVA